VQRRTCAPLAGVVATDGNEPIPGRFDLQQELRSNPRRAVKRLLSMIPPGTGKLDALAIVGIGATGGALTHEDPTQTQLMVQAWEQVSHRVSPGCSISEAVQ